MNIWKTAIGLELTETELRIAVVRVLLGRFRLEKCLRIGGFAEMSEDQKTEAIARLVKSHKLRASRVSLSVPRDSGVIRQLEYPIGVLRSLKSTLALQLETLSPWSADEVYWDFALHPVKSGAKTIRVTVAIIPRPVLDSWIAFFKSAGLPLTGARLSPVSLAQGLALLSKPLDPAVVIRSEPGYLEGTLVRGEGITSLTMSQSAEPSIELLLAKLASLSQLTEIPDTKRIVYGVEKGSVENLGSTSVPVENIARASAYGFGAVASALAEFASSPFKVNLVPASLRYRRNQLELVPTYVLILMAAVLGLAMVTRAGYQTRAYASRLQSEIQRLDPEVKKVLAQQTEIKGIAEKDTVLRSYSESRDLNLEALRELARMLPLDCWLMNYSYQDETIVISGVARSASEVQKILAGSSLFKEVQSTSAITRDPTGREHFGIRMKAEAPR